MLSKIYSNGWKLLLGAAAILLLITSGGYALTLLTTAARELGQPDFISSAANTPDANSASHPSAVAIDRGVTPNRLYFADNSNNRVLVYLSVSALANGAPANLVIGQPNFVSIGCNSTGRNAASLCTPNGIAVDTSGRVYVADGGNNRVLVFSRPTTNGASAIAVFGQGGDFSSGNCNLGGGPDADSLCNPASVAFDSFGNVYIADFNNNRVLEYNTPFAVTAVAGSGDAVADLEFGQGNGSGNDFTDNTSNFGGLSGTSISGPEDVAVDSKANVYIAEFNNSRVLEYHETTSATAPPKNTTANLEFGQGNGSGNDFIQGNCNTTGLTSQSLCNPVGLTVDSNNHLYIGDWGNNRELEFNNPATNTTANLVFGQANDFTSNACDLGGPTNFAGASSQTLCNPARSAVDSNNNFYLADDNNNRVLVFSQPTNPPSNNTANIVLGQVDFFHSASNIVDSTAFNTPENVVVDTAGHLYVSDFSNNRVLGFLNASSFVNGASATLVIGQPDFFSASCNVTGVNAATLCEPAGVAVDGANNLYVADNVNHRVLIYFTPFTTSPTVPGSGDSIADVVIGQGGDFTSNGCNAFGTPNAETLCNPDGLAIDPLGDLWVADSQNHRVLEYYSPLFNSTANFVLGQPDFFHNQCNQSTTPSGSTLCTPAGVRADSHNNIYVADFNNNRVLEYNNPLGSNNHTANNVWGQGGAFTTNACNQVGLTAKSLCQPNDIAFDANGNLYIADFGNSRALEFNAPLPNITANRVFGQADDFTANSCNLGGSGPSAATACHITSVATDTIGNLYVADAGNNRVLQYDPPHFAPAVLTFGKRQTAQTTYLVNTQGVWLNNINIKISGGSAFTVTKNSCSSSLAPQGQCAVTVSVARTGPGSGQAVATLSARDDATNSPQHASLSQTTTGGFTSSREANGSPFSGGPSRRSGSFIGGNH